MNACSQWKTQAACPTAQNTTHVDRRAHGRANSRPHAHTTRQNMERECPNPDTKPKLKTWVPGSQHHAPTRNKAHKRERARLEHTRSCALTWKQDMTGVSGLCHKPWITLDRSDRTPTDLFTYLLVFQISSNYFNLILIYLFICLLVCILVFQMSSNYFN